MGQNPPFLLRPFINLLYSAFLLHATKGRSKNVADVVPLLKAPLPYIFFFFYQSILEPTLAIAPNSCPISRSPHFRPHGPRDDADVVDWRPLGRKSLKRQKQHQRESPWNRHTVSLPIPFPWRCFIPAKNFSWEGNVHREGEAQTCVPFSAIGYRYMCVCVWDSQGLKRGERGTTYLEMNTHVERELALVC